MKLVVPVMIVCLLSLVDEGCSEDKAITVRTNPYHVNAGTIAKSDVARTVRIVKLINRHISHHSIKMSTSDLSEGHYLAFFGEDVDFAFSDLKLPEGKIWISPIEIIRIDKPNEATAKLPEDAMARISPELKIAIFRPPGITTSAIQKIPVADLEEPDEETVAFSKLLDIGQALHNWEDVYGGFPPAVIRGPDGTPWHSWRILILPFLGEGAFYNEYHFDEPWNGPHNIKLHDRIPEAYQFSKNEKFLPTSTHFVAAVGLNTAFNPQGLTNDDPEHWTFGDYKAGIHGLKLDTVTDGSSNTLVVGSANPNHPIHWLNPVDVRFSDKLGPPGSPQSFGATILSKDQPRGAFLWIDGTVSTISKGIHPAAFQTFFTVAGDDTRDGRQFSGGQISERKGIVGMDNSSRIEFIERDRRKFARIIYRSSE